MLVSMYDSTSYNVGRLPTEITPHLQAFYNSVLKGQPAMPYSGVGILIDWIYYNSKIPTVRVRIVT
jgi:hypothetical protein